jgi:hypothetical protein
VHVDDTGRVAAPPRARHAARVHPQGIEPGDDEQHGLYDETPAGTSVRKPDAHALAQLRERMQVPKATEIADAVGITARQVKRIRNGRSVPKPATRLAIERALMHFESVRGDAIWGEIRKRATEV